MRRLPLPNMKSALVDKFGKIIPPWNSFFQQFTQDAPAVEILNLTGSPFTFQSNTGATIIVSGGTVSLIQIIRGQSAITIATSTATPVLVPLSIGDAVSITYTVAPTVRFLGD